MALIGGLFALQNIKGDEVPFVVEGPEVDSSNFKVTVFASGLDFPNGMAELPDGSLIVTGGDGAANYFSSPGQLIRLIDTDGDGTADGSAEILYSGLAPTLTAVCASNELIFATGSGAPIYIFRAGVNPPDNITLIGQINFDYSGSTTYHANTALTLRNSPGFDDRYDLFFQIGSEENFEETFDLIPISSEDVLNTFGTLARAAAHMITLQDHGTHFEMIAVTQVASGVRNASGFAIHPIQGDLWFHDNGIDGLVDQNEPHSADELNFIPFSSIGNSIHDFGFPDNYTAYRTGTFVGGEEIEPKIAFQPFGDPQTGLRSEGPNGITFAPPNFPVGLNDGLFIGFHGKLFFGGLNNDENPVVYADPVTGDYFHFIRGQQAGIGHLIGLHSSTDALYVADLTTGGFLLDGAGEGVIYRIEALAPQLNQIYDLWAGGTFTNAFTQTDQGADPDGDMLSNLLEFSFGTDPTVADASVLSWDDATLTPGTPVVERNDSADEVDFTARFLRRIDGSVSYAVQFSSDLTEWESSADSPSWSNSPTVVTTVGDYELVETHLPLLLDNSSKPQFFRLQVTSAP